MRNYKTTILFISLCMTVLLVTGCGLLGGGDASSAVLGSDSPEPLAGSVQTICSETCQNQGQCGTAVQQADQPQVVLLNQSGPNLSSHDILVGIGNAADVIDVRDTTVIRAANNQEQTQLRFYQLSFPQNGSTGWVAGWCIQQ